MAPKIRNQISNLFFFFLPVHAKPQLFHCSPPQLNIHGGQRLDKYDMECRKACLQFIMYAPLGIPTRGVPRFVIQLWHWGGQGKKPFLKCRFLQQQIYDQGLHIFFYQIILLKKILLLECLKI